MMKKNINIVIVKGRSITKPVIKYFFIFKSLKKSNKRMITENLFFCTIVMDKKANLISSTCPGIIFYTKTPR